MPAAGINVHLLDSGRSQPVSGMDFVRADKAAQRGFGYAYDDMPNLLSVYVGVVVQWSPYLFWGGRGKILTPLLHTQIQIQDPGLQECQMLVENQFILVSSVSVLCFEASLF